METRTSKLIIGTAGGTAAKGSKTYKISIPSKWVRELSLDEKKLQLVFDGKSILVKPEESLAAFIENKKQRGHRLIKIRVFNHNDLCAVICADYSDQTVKYEAYEKNYLNTPFGNNLYPDFDDYEDYLKERCIPESRMGLSEYLDALNVDSFNPLEIIKKTKGVMAEDHVRLEVEEIG